MRDWPEAEDLFEKEVGGKEYYKYYKNIYERWDLKRDSLKSTHTHHTHHTHHKSIVHELLSEDLPWPCYILFCSDFINNTGLGVLSFPPTVIQFHLPHVSFYLPIINNKKNFNALQFIRRKKKNSYKQCKISLIQTKKDLAFSESKWKNLYCTQTCQLLYFNYSPF